MKRYLGIIFLFVGMLNMYAADITSSLDITVPPLVDGVYPHKRRAVFIEQNFLIKNIEQDSIRFSIDPNNTFATFLLSKWESYNEGTLQDDSFGKIIDFFQFKVVVNGVDQSKQIHFSNGKLTIPVNLKKKCQQIKIHYRYIHNHSQFYAGIPTRPTAQFARTDYCNDYPNKTWYFNADSISWEYVKIHVPHNENLEILSNYKLRYQNYTYHFDFAHSVDDELTFFIVEKDYWLKKSISNEHTKLNFCTQKYFDIDTLTWNPINVTSPSEEQLGKDAQATLELCEQIRSFFNDSTDKTFDVFKCKYTGGGFVNNNKNNRYLVCYDSIFWDKYISMMPHEYFHCFMQYPQDRDSMYYFFAESMTVFGTLCIGYINGTLTENDNIEYWMQMYGTYLSQAKEVSETPIINIDYGCRVATDVIYYKGPYMIYLFTKRIGLDNFIDILRRYYVYIRENSMYVTLENFEAFFKQNGVSDADWEYFVSLLS